jgi:nicotinate-nucleotide pyrophosphorylase (carboxylating)
VPNGFKIEVETKNLQEVKEALASGVNTIMLDNMSVEMVREAVALVGKRALVEASGNVTLDTVEEIAGTGVDLISIGALTHSAPAADISLKIVESSQSRL